jgi:hypothetical protein
MAAAHGSGTVGESRKCDSGHDFGSGLPRRKRARRGTRLGARVSKPRPGKGHTAAARGHRVPARNRAREKAGKRRKRGQRCSLPQREAPAALARLRKAVGGGAVMLRARRRRRLLRG